jgi:hypothetical protein
VDVFRLAWPERMNEQSVEDAARDRLAFNQSQAGSVAS